MKVLITIFGIALLLLLAVSFLSEGDSLTGTIVVGEIACYDDKDCDDGIAATEDICRNPGSEFSLCVNR